MSTPDSGESAGYGTMDGTGGIGGDERPGDSSLGVDETESDEDQNPMADAPDAPDVLGEEGEGDLAPEDE